MCVRRASKGWYPPPFGIRKGYVQMNLFVLKTWLQAKFARDERGASMVEYILLVALIALAVIAAVVFLRGQVQSKFSDAGSQLSNSGS
jgi:Flp pilus assembly pilin Flp